MDLRFYNKDFEGINIVAVTYKVTATIFIIF